ncbi:MAG: hemerythrin domain-containing protein [Methanotrichaceae archaeon]
MESTEGLTDEHKEIAVFLAIIEEIANRLASMKGARAEDLQWLFEFNRDFVLRMHQGKEESLFFPVLRDIGVPEDPINILTGDHDALRGIAKTIRGLIEDYNSGDDGNVTSDLVDMLRFYAAFMKDHIEAEETVFYPIADKCISRENDMRLAARLKVSGAERIGIGRDEDLREILDSLKLFYGISKE